MPLGPWELAIILLIVIIIFGVGKLPQIGGALGQGIREFRQGATDPDKDNEQVTVVETKRNGDDVVKVSEGDRVTVVKDDKES